ncbi:discoidin domain-containing protein [Paenibacillus sp. P26]|nr:discoidin domain-containing protein [Paenibacillus sp. P26]
MKISVDYTKQDGTVGDTVYGTTDGSKLFVADESDLITNVTGITYLIDSTSTSGRTAAQTLQQVNYLFDGNASTNSDFRLNGSGSGSYITFDFKEGNQVTLSSVELLARQDRYYNRIAGTVVQGSNDNTTWTTLTKAAVSTLDWQMLQVSGSVPYRYIRMYNPGAWFGNMAELRFHGVVKPADVTPPVTTDDAPQGPVNKDTTVSFKAADDGSGVAATYFTVDGGTEQTGNKVTLTAEGRHTLVYWSADRAGNLEQPHTITVIIDKTSPVTTATVNPEAPNGGNGWYKSNVSVSFNVYDNLSGTAKTEISLDGGSTWLTYTAPVTLSQDSKYTVSYRSTDKAGNVETVKSIGFNLDATAPSVTVSGVVYGTFNDSLDITPTVTLSDSLSGVDSGMTTVTLDTYGIRQGTTIPLYTLPLGSHTLIVTASDMAGNTGTQTVIFQTTTSIESLQALVTRFKNAGWIDNEGIANSLQSKLTTINLADFVSEVQAQSGKHISSQAAGYLLRDAQYLLSKK